MCCKKENYDIYDHDSELLEERLQEIGVLPKNKIWDLISDYVIKQNTKITLS